MDTKTHQKMLFKSFNPLDWASRDSWIRRAIYWKYMAMALESNQTCENEKLKSAYEISLRADLILSPDSEAIQSIANIAIPTFNSRKKPENKDINNVKKL